MLSTLMLGRMKDLFVAIAVTGICFFLFLQGYIRFNNVSQRISGTIANGSQFAGTGPIARTRAAGIVSTKGERRKTVEGQLSCEGPSGIPWRVEEYTGGGGRGGETVARRTAGRRGETGERLIHF